MNQIIAMSQQENRSRRKAAVLKAAALAKTSVYDRASSSPSSGVKREQDRSRDASTPPADHSFYYSYENTSDKKSHWDRVSSKEEKRIGNMPPSPLVTPPTQSVTRSPRMSPQNPPGDTHSQETTPSRGVPHVYHDYSQIPDQPGYIRKKTGGVTNPFPEKLYDMLDEETKKGGQVVAWLPHGRAFIVRRPKEFAQTIMPQYFRQSKLTSFQRQLNLYGFRRITQGPDGGAYYHEMFLRGRPALCFQMKRQKIKGTGHKQPADVNTEPNFYAMPMIRPDSTTTPPPALSARASGVPCSPGLHGAAHLLRGIALGFNLPPAPFLGSSAGETPFSNKPPSYSGRGGSREETKEQRGASFLLPKAT